MKDHEFLSWLASRLHHVYGESEYTDFVRKTAAIARRLRRERPEPGTPQDEFRPWRPNPED